MFRTPRYSAMMPPVTLPLVLAELDRSGQISKKRELSKEAAFGEVFSFAFTGSGEKNLGLAIVRETIKEPVLVILVSNDSGETWHRKGTYMLKQLPVRMNLLLTEKQAFAGLAFQAEQGFEVTSFKCEL